MDAVSDSTQGDVPSPGGVRHDEDMRSLQAVGDEIRNVEEQILSLGEEVRQVEEEVRQVEEEVKKVVERIENVELQISNTRDRDERVGLVNTLDYLRLEKISLRHKGIALRQKGNALRQEKNALRQKENTLRQKENTLQQKKDELLRRKQALRTADSPKLPAARLSFQLIVQSARRSYLEWERIGKKFLEVKGDPFANFSGAFLIWVRKCYVDLKNILVEEEAKGLGQRFILLGTAGIGKSFFTIFWVCYLATKNKRIVWKLADGSCFLLDFSQEAATAQGPADTLNHPVLLQVVNDEDSWLIIDGGQKTGLYYPCSILLACSAKKENHHEFGKGFHVKTWYLPVWTEDEIKRFCDAFVEHKSEFSAMDVPGKDTALANFKELGGIPRYVLHAGKMVQGRAKLRRALDSVSAENCLQVYAGLFNPEFSDMLIHMFVDDEEEYTRFEYDFACSDVRHLMDQQLMKIGKLNVVSFLEQNIKSSALGTMWGHMYELVAHVILSRGGDFKRKRVSETGGEVRDTLQQRELKLVTFTTLRELTKLKDDYPGGAYCQPSSLNFESADAVIVPDTLVQYFKYRKGNHGYKIHGLKELDKALNLSNYSLWSCVPQESFEETKYQNWVTTKGTKYKNMTSKVQGLLQKMQQYVVEVDYRRYLN